MSRVRTAQIGVSAVVVLLLAFWPHQELMAYQRRRVGSRTAESESGTRAIERERLTRPESPASRKKTGEEVAEQCNECHGEGGHSETPDIPSIAGFSMLATMDLLDTYRLGLRQARTVMRRCQSLTHSGYGGDDEGVWRGAIQGEELMGARIVMAVSVCLAGLFAHAEDALTNADIVRLTQAGLAPVAIMAKIRSSPGAFDTSVDALVGLAEAGVDSEVVAAMVAAAGPTAAGRAEGLEAPSPAASPDVGPAPPLGRDRSPAVEMAQPRAIPGSTFREALRSGGEGPEMVVIPAGRFRMGCLSNDEDCFGSEKPVHEVTIATPFALSAHEVTFEDYDRFTYPNKVDDEGWGRGTRPVINVSWDDAQDYVEWLSAQTGGEYRLPSESEWEYAARAGTTTKYSWGDEIGVNRANCDNFDCGDRFEYTAPAGSFRANGFGLHDMHGNVNEWVADCRNGSYSGAPTDGSAWLHGECGVRVLRGGSWVGNPRYHRAAFRDWVTTVVRNYNVGFRVARTLAP